MKFFGSTFFSKKVENRIPASSTVSCKSVFTTGAYNAVLSLCARQAKNRLAGGALAVNMSFSISELIFLKIEKITEPFVLTSALRDIFRKHTVADNNYQRNGQGIRGEIYPQGIERGLYDV